MIDIARGRASRLFLPAGPFYVPGRDTGWVAKQLYRSYDATLVLSIYPEEPLRRRWLVLALERDQDAGHLFLQTADNVSVLRMWYALRRIDEMLHPLDGDSDFSIDKLQDEYLNAASWPLRCDTQCRQYFPSQDEFDNALNVLSEQSVVIDGDELTFAVEARMFSRTDAVRRTLETCGRYEQVVIRQHNIGEPVMTSEGHYTVEVFGGSFVQTVIGESIALACKLNACVSFNFNNTVASVAPDSDFETVNRVWHETYELNRTKAVIVK